MKRVIHLLLLILLTSCANYKDIPYFQNSAEYDGSQGAQLYDMTIKPKDQLTVFVFSGTDKEAVAQFNMRDITVLETNSRRLNTRGGHPVHRYLVDNEGNIDFPILGKIHLAGFTISQANNHIKELITPYLSKTADCVVNVNIENYEVTVMGEVAKPNTFTVTRNKITVLEALAMAGDMTIYGKRDNVKLLREMDNGEYEIHELDLRDANILNSPYYYLQQRDVVYVEPNVAMAQNAKIGRTRQLWVRGASITISLGSLLYRVLK
ncbi:MAG: polysaccharide biosynthesis/export family protein [Prevotella sp.]|nr:polysaccharide biosynthesis/export family protein [Prevotella sp.]